MKTIQPQTDRSKGMPVAVFVLFNNNFIKNPTKGRKFPVAQVAGKVEGCYNIIDILRHTGGREKKRSTVFLTVHDTDLGEGL